MFVTAKFFWNVKVKASQITNIFKKFLNLHIPFKIYIGDKTKIRKNIVNNWIK